MAAAREAGLLVIADGKRGDVPVSAAAYAQALFGSTPTPWGDVAGLGADAATVNPLLGGDALEPLLDAAADGGRRPVRAWCAPPTPARPICSTCRPPRRRCSSAWPTLVAERADRLTGRVRAVRHGGGGRGNRAPPSRRACAS